MNNNILLESGTGEVELLQFVIGGNTYAINVIKVKEVLVVPPGSVTKLPNAHPSISGLILCRDEIVTLIDLKYVLEKQRNNADGFKVLICEFNKVKVAFSIDNILGVCRVQWKEILKPNDIAGTDSLVIGNIIFNNKITLLLDFEKIVTDISPSTGISEDKIINIEYKDRSKIKVLLADDSPLIRKLLKDTLLKAGFKNLIIFDDGKQAFDYLIKLFKEKRENFIEDAQLLITDIEMPQMDGLTLTRKIKEDPILKKLPVIIFSSLITTDLKHKGESVGANAQLSKPEIGELVDVIDTYIFAQK